IREGEVAGIPARVARVSFSGELAFEVSVDGRRGLELWEALAAAGEVTPFDLGLDWIVSRTKPDFVGKRSFARADTSRPDRKQLVALLPLDPRELVPEGAQLAETAELTPPVPMLGH